jgi:HSP20 family protein
MAMGDLVPWRWGGLARQESETRSRDWLRREMDVLHREMERVFEGFWQDPTQSLAGVASGFEFSPQMDVTEDDNAFTVSLELPGMTERDVDIALSDRILTIRGNKSESQEIKDKDVYRRERCYGSFRRTLELPGDVDSTRIEASFKSGVLKVELPKTKEAKAKIKHISVKAA